MTPTPSSAPFRRSGGVRRSGVTPKPGLRNFRVWLQKFPSVGDCRAPEPRSRNSRAGIAEPPG
eukprot:8593272-Alexandrium_andersonii.AAC.1